MNYDDDIWQEGQDDECVNCGGSGASCNCDYEDPVCFEKATVMLTQIPEYDDTETWRYIYSRKGVWSEGEVFYNTDTQKYEVKITTITDPDDDEVEQSVLKSFDELEKK